MPRHFQAVIQPLLPQVVATAAVGPRDVAPAVGRAQARRYLAGSLFVAPEKVAAVAATVFQPGWDSTDNFPGIFVRHTQVSDAQLKGAIVSLAEAGTIAGWTATGGARAFDRRYARVAELVRQERPTLATLPVLLAGLAEISRRGNPPTFFEVSEFVAPEKFGIIAVAAVSPVAWDPTEGLAAVSLRHMASPDWSAPDKSGLITPAAITCVAWDANEVLPAILLRHAVPTWSAPEKFDLVVAATVSSVAWDPTEGLAAIAMRHATSPNWSSPDKFGLITAAVPTMSSWTATLGHGSVVLRYAVSDFVNQVRPTLATLPAFTWSVADGQKSQPPTYQDGDFFTMPTFIAAAQTTPMVFIERVAGIVQLRFVRPETWTGPHRVLPFVETITLDKWRQLEPAAKYSGRFWPTPTFASTVLAIPFVPPPGPFVVCKGGFATIESLMAAFQAFAQLGGTEQEFAALVAAGFKVICND